MKIIAQCQRCGRGFIILAEGVTKDGYANPRSRSSLACYGSIKMLQEPIPVDHFRNYGPLLPTNSTYPANRHGREE